MGFWNNLGDALVDMEERAYQEELDRELLLAQLRVNSRRYGRPVLVPVVAIRPTYEERRAQRAEADVRRIQAEAESAEARIRRHEAERAHDAIKAQERAAKALQDAKMQAEFLKTMAAKKDAKAQAKLVEAKAKVAKEAAKRAAKK